MVTLTNAENALKTVYLGAVTEHIDTQKVQEISPQ